MEDDWDLHAVVRSCCSSTTTATTAVSSFAATDSQNFSSFEQDCSFTWSQHPFEARRNRFAVEDLHELWKPFFPKQQILPISPLSVLQDLSSDQLQQQQQEIKQFTPPKQPLFSIVSGSKPSTTSHHPTPRSKKRKHHSKKVCHVAAESLSSDMWSWRKYGQKPIKGSPYPRGYYRCSTSKGCMARKQVERNRSDPGMFIITYTGDHNHPVPTHRNSLAGSTRQKPSSDDPKKPKLSPAPEKMESIREDFAEVEEEDEEEDDDDLSGMKVIADDDFFAGLEDFAGDCLPENSEFPWLAAGATTTRRPAAVE